MPPKCSVCLHPDRQEIDRALLAGASSFRNIAERFGTSTTALHRHKTDHLSGRLVEAAERNVDADVRTALDVVAELRRVNDAARRVLKDAQDAGDGGLTLAASDRILKQVEVQSRLIGLLNDGNVTKVSVNVGADWPALRTAILRALVPYPDARAAVVDALSGEGE